MVHSIQNVHYTVNPMWTSLDRFGPLIQIWDPKSMVPGIWTLSSRVHYSRFRLHIKIRIRYNDPWWYKMTFKDHNGLWRSITFYGGPQFTMKVQNGLIRSTMIHKGPKWTIKVHKRMWVIKYITSEDSEEYRIETWTRPELEIWTTLTITINHKIEAFKAVFRHQFRKIAPLTKRPYSKEGEI